MFDIVKSSTKVILESIICAKTVWRMLFSEGRVVSRTDPCSLRHHLGEIQRREMLKWEVEENSFTQMFKLKAMAKKQMNIQESCCQKIS